MHESLPLHSGDSTLCVPAASLPAWDKHSGRSPQQPQSAAPAGSTFLCALPHSPGNQQRGKAVVSSSNTREQSPPPPELPVFTLLIAGEGPVD
ncbi:hypothetical protein JZ751_002781 [Albula glossodonta]|uniref:Uncharacterized protein n=1 Tax=Albula glossodonta TaxID=121402 RepID=A0A8T2N909_9TELE|nr:hypothetical protein JZ751_002781 [Albula glossodonta]